MTLSASTCLALAQHGCTNCLGVGTRPAGKQKVTTACNCVWRAVFRAVFTRFRKCAEQPEYMAKSINLERFDGHNAIPLHRSARWNRGQDFQADVILIARRTLTKAQYALFKYHFLYGADWKLCARKLNIDRGEFFHEVYRIQQRLGRAYAEIEPYALFPTDQYFGGSATGALISDLSQLPAPRGERRPLRAPLQQQPVASAA